MLHITSMPGQEVGLFNVLILGATRTRPNILARHHFQFVICNFQLTIRLFCTIFEKPRAGGSEHDLHKEGGVCRMSRWRVVFSGLFAGFLTVCVLVGVAIAIVLKYRPSETPTPVRWHAITPTPTRAITPTLGPTLSPSIPSSLRIGWTAYVVSRVGVRMRHTPGYRGKPKSDIIAVVPPHAAVVIIDGPHQADNLVWWKVRWRSYEGWIAEIDPKGVRLLSPTPP